LISSLSATVISRTKIGIFFMHLFYRPQIIHSEIALGRAELPNIRFHDLRHTAATLMLQQGIHPKVVQERLGHADISMTLRTYSHVLPDIQEEAAEKFDLLLVSPESKMNSDRIFLSQAHFPKIEI
jgi:hypothetical protein